MENKKPLGITDRTIATIAGFFIGILIIVIMLKLFSSYGGALVGILINGGCTAYYLKKYSKNKTISTYITYGVLAATIFSLLIGLLILGLVNIMFQDIAN